MLIKIRYLGIAKDYTKKSEDKIDVASTAKLSDLLNKLAADYGKEFIKDIYEPGMKEVKPVFMMMINGIVIGQLDGTDTKLKDGDTVVLMPLLEGG